MSRSRAAEHGGSHGENHPGAHRAARERPARARDHARERAVWVFLMQTGTAGRTTWYWARGGSHARRARRCFGSFELCVADAREHGFDFDQPYHVTAGA